MKKLVLACLVAAGSLAAEVKVLALAGSIREDSYNKKLIREAAAIAREMGADVTVIDLKDFSLPFYDADLEKSQGLPINAKRLKDLMIGSDAVIIASPEYNASMTAILKNAIDWTTRGEKGGGSHEAFEGKKFAIMSASPGKRGGARSLAHLRQVIEDAHGTVLPKQVVIPRAHTVFNDKGVLESDLIKEEIKEEIQDLLK